MTLFAGRPERLIVPPPQLALIWLIASPKDPALVSPAVVVTFTAMAVQA